MGVEWGRLRVLTLEEQELWKTLTASVVNCLQTVPPKTRDQQVLARMHVVQSLTKRKKNLCSSAPVGEVLATKQAWAPAAKGKALN
jgi:hypothetical protein